MNDNIQNSQVNDEQTSNIKNITDEQTTNIQNITTKQSTSTITNPQGVALNLVSRGNKSNKLGIILGIVAIFLIAVGFTCYYFISINNPTTIYRKLVKKGVNEIYDAVSQNDDKINTTINMDFDLALNQELLDKKVLDLINKTTIGFNYQMDKNSGQLVLKLDSDYGKDSLIDLQLFVDSKNEKTYLYAKDYYDKYLELEMDDYSSFVELVESGKLTQGQIKNSKKAKKIIIDEFTKIIKSEDCSKQDGAYVFKITEKEFLNRLKSAMINLKNNQKFLDCYEDSNMIKGIISAIIDGIDVSSASTQTIKISINKKMFSSKIDKLVVSSMGSDVIFENKEGKTTYELYSSKMLVLNGYIDTKEAKNITKYEFLLEIPMFGKLKINFDTTNKKNKDIDKVNVSKVQSFNDIKEEEQNDIISKIQSSKIYEIITSISGNLKMDTDSFEEDLDYDSDEGEIDIEFDENNISIDLGGNDIGLDYDIDLDDNENNSTLGSTNSINIQDYKTISLNIPAGFTNTYNSDTYKTYKKDNIEITIKSSYYDNEDEYFKILNSTAEYAKKDKYYNNVVLSGKNTKSVGGTKYYYKDYSYEYRGLVSDTKYYEKHICTNVGENYYLVFEVSSKDTAISDSLLDSILSIK